VFFDSVPSGSLEAGLSCCGNTRGLGKGTKPLPGQPAPQQKYPMDVAFVGMVIVECGYKKKASLKRSRKLQHGKPGDLL
jgi:hypothetical protein